MSATKKIRVLIVDDSAVVRRMIHDVLSQDPEIEVVGTACDPYVARDKILETNPDVITLDIEMPRMDGITFLKILQKHHPIPVVIISSLTQAGSQKALEALAAGAVEVLAKPSSAYSIGQIGSEIAYRVKGAAAVRAVRQPLTQGVVASKPVRAGAYNPRQLIVIGSSTGGTEALKALLTCLPAGLPGICIVQHIPPYFSKVFAERMNSLCQFAVREAADGDIMQPGLALVAPGDYHMLLSWRGDRYKVNLRQGPAVNHSRPSVDVLFNTAAECVGRYAVAVILTGMGKDGAQGMLRLKGTGARTIAQNEETCVVYGMPRAAVEAGAVDIVLPLHRIPQAILDAVTPVGAREAAHAGST